MRKDEYRHLFAQCKQFIKFNNVCKAVGVSPSAYYQFMKGSEFNWLLSVEKLELMRLCIINTLEKIA